MADARRREGRDAPWRRAWRVLRRESAGVLARAALPAGLRLLARSWRTGCEGRRTFEAALRDGPLLVAMWHGRMLAPLPAHAGRGIGVLVSPSREGELVETILRKFGYRVIRGSSSRYGARALREMRSVLDHSGAVVITPDGPRGPRHSMNVGLAWLARETGAPIMPVGIACDRAWRLASWDRFTIPKPRARVQVVYGDTLEVAEDATDEELETSAAEVRRRLLEAEAAGFAALRCEPDW